MSIAGFPTSSDIYLEVDGTRVAVVQSYTARATKSSTAVEAFGSRSRWPPSPDKPPTWWS